MEEGIHIQIFEYHPSCIGVRNSDLGDLGYCTFFDGLNENSCQNIVLRYYIYSGINIDYQLELLQFQLLHISAGADDWLRNISLHDCYRCTGY